MFEISKGLFVTVLKVVEVKGQHLFDCKGRTFPKIDAVAFSGPSEQSTVPCLLFRGDPLEDDGQRWFFHEYGTHGASTAVFQRNFREGEDKFKGRNLEAVWFKPRDVLVIVGHCMEFNKESLDSFLGDS
ncbi:hypothetical protein CL630_03115 [bacterium]|nr:hypothetical protein [bacterium]|tara:strand:- start:16056 stop:16442 length:387 start_codon:yes stop_codon:yes gene_type:complete